ncbi:hypothetical protein VP01_654g2 [Puccinia sorghi]|uniref:Uncharacterized protein n=1 Tax=Puccinia sorghi TaxID=27349 RepID=A0A0L6UHJ7_9BASI|nr:hypothetical protein VP01_654g2 [Puccinia sorghi]
MTTRCWLFFQNPVIPLDPCLLLTVIGPLKLMDVNNLVTKMDKFDYRIGGECFVSILTLIFLYCIKPMDTPTFKKFRSIDELVEFGCLWDRNHGYGISIRISHSGDNIYICCDCGVDKVFFVVYGKKQRSSVCPSFLLRSLKSFIKSISTICSTQMWMEIVDSGAFWRQWNMAKTVVFGCSMNQQKILVKNSVFTQGYCEKDGSQASNCQYLPKNSCLPLCGGISLIYSQNHKFVRQEFKNGSHLHNTSTEITALALLKATDRSKLIPPFIGSTKMASQVTGSWRSELKDYFSIYVETHLKLRTETL